MRGLYMVVGLLLALAAGAEEVAKWNAVRLSTQVGEHQIVVEASEKEGRLESLVVTLNGKAIAVPAEELKQVVIPRVGSLSLFYEDEALNAFYLWMIAGDTPMLSGPCEIHFEDGAFDRIDVLEYANEAQLFDEVPEDEMSELEKQLRKIIVPEIKLEDASMKETVAALRKILEEQWPEGKDTAFALEIGPMDAETTVRMHFNNVPFSEVLRYIGLGTGLEVVYEKDKVILRTKPER